MDPLVGLPDFGTALSSEAVQAFAPFGSTDAGAYAVVPNDGALAGITLTMTRRADELSGAGSYATLDVRIGCDYPLDDALTLARAQAPGATVRPLPIELGYARLVSGSAALALPSAMTTATMLGWSAADGARWTCRVDLDTAEVIKGALQGGSLVFGARIEFVAVGVAPRASARVSFVPATLATQLLKSGQTFVSREDLLNRLENSPAALTVVGAATIVEVAEALADRLLSAFGRFAPAPGPFDPPGFFINASLPIERVDWDLSIPQAVSRAVALRLDTLTGLAKLDPASLVRELTIPALDVGFRDVVLAANLPDNRLGAPAIGVRLSAPPAPPNRPSGINKTLVFSSPDNGGLVSLRFDPDETFAYDLTAFAVVTAGSLVHELDAAPRPSTATWLDLSANDFPVTFSHITASQRLIAQARVSGTLDYAFGGQTASLPFALGSATADVALAMPSAATGASISLTATTPGGAVASLPAFAAGRILLDVSSFPGYGPHRVALHCDFASGEAPLTLDLAPEQGSGAASVTLVPAAPDAAWGYVAASPFHAGYRYRPAGGTWSAVLAPGARLNLKPDGSLTNDASGGGDSPPAAFEIDGVQVTIDPNASGVLRYLPATPTPELDSTGSPTVLVMKMAQTTSLQLGALLDLPPGGGASLMTRISAMYPSLVKARLEPAPITVNSVAVMLADDTGAKAQIGTSTSSAFPPFAAIFAIALSPTQAEQAISAIGGRRGLLSVDYTILPFGADTPQVRSADVATWFNGTDGLSHVRVLG